MDIRDELDWPTVVEAIKSSNIGSVKLADWDIEDAIRVCHMAAERWLHDDVRYGYQLTHLETRFDIKTKLPPVAGVIDLGLRSEEGLILVDWKTSRNTLDLNWQQRLLDSFQWRIYAAVTGATKFKYRGMTRPKGVGRNQDPEDKIVEFKELTIDIPQTNRQEVIEQLGGFYAMRNSLTFKSVTGIPLNPIWPRNGRSCFSFGRRCDYYADCQGFSAPRGIPQSLHQVSSSQLDEFLLCPERYRRGQLANDGDDPVGKSDSEESSFGRVVHIGLAEIWRQGFML